MFHHGFDARRPIALSLLSGLLLAIGACGDDSPSGEGCTNDAQCKGDRICVENQCVDPEDAPPERDSGTAGSNGQAGRSSGNDGGTPPRAGSGAAGSNASQAGSSASQAGRPAVIDDPEFERVCSLNCEARHAAGCSMNIGSLDQCMAQCLVADEANWGYCLEDQTNVYACLASGGYTCVSGYPQPKSTCIAEQQAQAQCFQLAPCRRYCEQRAEACGDESEDCETECRATQMGFQDAICGVYYSQLVSCWGNQAVTCEDGVFAVGSCGPQISEIADCIGRRNHDCDGFCWAAETLGCGSETCVEDCKAKADETYCGSYYNRVIDCTIGSHALQLSCEDGTPTPGTQCMSQITDYDNCVAMRQ